MKSDADSIAGMPILQALLPVLDDDARMVAAFVLGSARKGRLRPDSDLDIALLPARNVRFSTCERLDLADRLGQAAGRAVDLGIADAQNLVYTKEAILNGDCFFVRDRVERDLRVAALLGMYVNLRESRKEVEDAYRR